MASQIEVVNQALIALESEPLTAISDPGDNAETVRKTWEMSRKFVLRDAEFNFARKYADLVPDPSAPPHPAIQQQPANGFRIPDDNIRVLNAISSDAIPIREWYVVGRWIYSVFDAITIRYTFDADIGLWDDTAAECLSYYLAAKMALAITQSNDVKQLAMQDYVNTKIAALAASGLEGTGEQLRVDGRLTVVRNSTGGRNYRYF